MRTLYKMIFLVQQELTTQLGKESEKVGSSFSMDAYSNSKQFRLENAFKKMLNVLVTLEDVKYQPPRFS